MILEKIKVAIQTSTKVKFITTIPVTITVREALPIIFKAYQSVVHQNYEDEEGKKLLTGNRITGITKNGFLIPLAEEVIHVLNDSDSLFITIGKHQKKEHESKKEKLESKKEEKNQEKAEKVEKVEKVKEKLVEQKKNAHQQEQEKNQPKPAQRQQKPVEQKKQSKKQEQKKPELKIQPKEMTKLLALVTGQAGKKPLKTEVRPKIMVVQPPSQSSDSD